MTTLNPWVDRVDCTLSDADLMLRLRVPAASVPTRCTRDPNLAAEMLAHRLRAIFVPTPQTCDVVRRLLARACAHLHLYYSDPCDYLRGVNASKPPLQETEAVCLTGLAGVGKTSIAKALKRLLCDTVSVTPGSGYPAVELESLWHVTVESSRALRDLLAQPLRGRLVDVASMRSDARLCECAGRIAHRHGVSLLVADEWQFVTQSAGANAVLTRLLHALRYVGLPLVFVANYSLVSRLAQRSQEDQHRLLSHPIVVHPDGPDDASTLDLYREYHLASEGALLLDSKEQLEQIYDYTRGLKRNRIALLTLSFRIACAAGKKAVGTEHLEAAYNSMEFARFRREAELLRRQELTGIEARKDLWCPFPLPAAEAATAAQRELDREQERLSTNVLMASLTPTERDAYQGIQAEMASPGKASARRRRPSPSLADLRAGSERYRLEHRNKK